MATWIVALVIIGAVYAAARYVYRTQQRGGCVGCSGGSCCHCTEIKSIKKGNRH